MVCPVALRSLDPAIDDERRSVCAGSGMNDDTVTTITIGAACEAVADRLRKAGLRPTRQRLALGELLFAACDRHVTAEILHAEAVAAGEQVSLATVYNTLHQFKDAGLLRELAIEGSKAYFDTNTSNHNHFYLERGGDLVDIPGDMVRVDGLPEPPAGMRISHIDVVVRLVPKEE
jgi:Fur family iron response transcriptional regulator